MLVLNKELIIIRRIEIIIIIIIMMMIIILELQTKKYWVDVQEGIVSSHGEKNPL